MNYQHLILLGAGTIGKGMLKVGKRQLDTFKTVTILDMLPLPKDYLSFYQNIDFKIGDAENLELLTSLMQSLSGRILVLNLCSEVDAVRMRKHIGKLGAAYLDTSAGVLPDRIQENFIDLMRYTHTHVDSPYPHWICWGMNPGLVEIVTRKMLMDMNDTNGNVHVKICEHDDLNVLTKDGKLGVGWSPSELITELMLTPTFEVKDGKAFQENTEGSKPVVTRWGNATVASRIVAHEDIWNLGLIPQVRSAKFSYALHPSVMDVLNGSVNSALELIGVPEDDVPLKGKDRIAVQVTSESNYDRCLVWETNHAHVWNEYGVNGVQFQVCKSIQVALDLLQHSGLGLLKGTYCASTLPLTKREFAFIKQSFVVNDVHWQPCDSLDLRIIDG